MRSGYYAYIPRGDGTEPMGTDRKIIRWDLKTDAGMVRHVRKYLGPTARVFAFRSFYDDSTFRQIV